MKHFFQKNLFSKISLHHVNTKRLLSEAKRPKFPCRFRNWDRTWKFRWEIPALETRALGWWWLPNRKNSITKRNQGDLYLLTFFFGGGVPEVLKKETPWLLFFFSWLNLHVWADGKRCLIQCEGPKETTIPWTCLKTLCLIEKNSYDIYILPPQTNECPLKIRWSISKKERKLYVPITIFFRGHSLVLASGILHLASGILGGAPSHISRFSKFRSFFWLGLNNSPQRSNKPSLTENGILTIRIFNKWCIYIYIMHFMFHFWMVFI